jgi:hypothetical protein
MRRLQTLVGGASEHRLDRRPALSLRRFLAQERVELLLAQLFVLQE